MKLSKKGETMANLAIRGGQKIRTRLFPDQNTMDDNEIQAVVDVMKRGRLSGYRGNWSPEFMGGPSVQLLEKEWQIKFGSASAIAVNSATSGLHITCGAIGLKPGDEVIVSPYSMSCSATAPMIYGAIPIFADIEKDYFCLDPKSVEERITKRTKAIIVVSLFGQPYSWEINRVARKHNLIVIEDAAQALGALFCQPEGLYIPDKCPKCGQKGAIQYLKDIAAWQKITAKEIPDNMYGCGACGETWIEFSTSHQSKFAGTLGDIGIYSFNYGKHITCGEGGMIVTNNPNLAFRCQLLRNHAEAVIKEMDNRRWIDESMVGFNMRMTELQAVIVSQQLRKFDVLQQQRIKNVIFLNTYLSEIPPIEIRKVRINCTHTYYVLPFLWNSEFSEGISRDIFIEAVKAELTERYGREGEGIPIGCGYIQPLYLLPLFQSKNNENYQKGSCPVCEDLSENRLFLTLYHSPNSTTDDMKDIVEAFHKVWNNRNEL